MVGERESGHVNSEEHASQKVDDGCRVVAPRGPLATQFFSGRPTSKRPGILRSLIMAQGTATKFRTAIDARKRPVLRTIYIGFWTKFSKAARTVCISCGMGQT